MLRKIVILMLGIMSIYSCANNNYYAGNVYTPDQIKNVRAVSYGTLVGMNSVFIQDTESYHDGNMMGMILGGAAAASGIGSGSGRIASGVAGAVVGSLIGGQVGQAVGKKAAYELEIKQDNGDHFIVVQTDIREQFYVGQRVRIVGNGESINVTPVVEVIN